MRLERITVFPAALVDQDSFIHHISITGSSPVFVVAGVDRGWAVGCVTWWLLCGRLVFEGDSSMQIILKHAKDDPLAPSLCSELAVPEEMDDLVLTCLEKDPQKRPSSAEELDARLRNLERADLNWTSKNAKEWWETNLPEMATTTGDIIPVETPARLDGDAHPPSPPTDT